MTLAGAWQATGAGAHFVGACGQGRHLLGAWQATGAGAHFVGACGQGITLLGH
jgi:hypothetical protein